MDSVPRPWHQRISSLPCFKSSIFCHFCVSFLFLFYIFLVAYVLVFVFGSGNRLDRWWCSVIPISKLQREKEKLLFFGKHLEWEENSFWLIVVFLSASLSLSGSKIQTHRSYPCLVRTLFFQHHLLPSLMGFDLCCLCLVLLLCFDDSQNNILIVYLDF